MRPLRLLSVVLVLVVAPQSAVGLGVAYSLEHYVQFNDLVVEGTLIADGPVSQEDRLEDRPGWYLPTNRACIVIHRILQQSSELDFSVGDTVCFRYPTSSQSRNPDVPDQIGFNGEEWQPLSIEVCERGVYAVDRRPNNDLRRGAWFELSEEQTLEVLHYFESKAAE